MLLDNFYTILQIRENDNCRIVSIRLNPAHILYQGHFPEQPVVPGVCMLQMIKESIEAILNCTLQYQQITSCKFLSAINPANNSVLELSIRLEETEEKQIKLQSTGTYNQIECIKLKASLIRK